MRQKIPDTVKVIKCKDCPFFTVYLSSEIGRYYRCKFLKPSESSVRCPAKGKTIPFIFPGQREFDFLKEKDKKMKIKIFKDDMYFNIESKVNDFISEGNRELIDVKVDQVSFPNGHFSLIVIVLYKDKE